ncbi:hypothetical protein [Pseudomonas guineae]|uniref:hypothetical protein n=1 Tax=Pseudomonas guineae TaxID=425504 RepID=UPI0030ED7E25
MNPWFMVLLLGVMLSPLAWLAPSRRQRGQMDVRLQARRMGVAMQLSPQTWPHWLLRQPPDSCPQYHQPRRRGQADSWCYWQLEPGQWVNKWREPCTDQALLAQLQALPADAFKVEATDQMLSICWGERGASAALEEIVGFLKAIA